MKYIKCPTCGRYVSKDEEICLHCGSQLHSSEKKFSTKKSLIKLIISIFKK